MKTVIPKRPGRPATGRQPLVAFRLPHEILEYIDTLRTSHGSSRSRIIRSLIDEGIMALDRRERIVRRKKRLTAPPPEARQKPPNRSSQTRALAEHGEADDRSHQTK